MRPVFVLSVVLTSSACVERLSVEDAANAYATLDNAALGIGIGLKNAFLQEGDKPYGMVFEPVECSNVACWNVSGTVVPDGDVDWEGALTFSGVMKHADDEGVQMWGYFLRAEGTMSYAGHSVGSSEQPFDLAVTWGVPFNVGLPDGTTDGTRVDLYTCGAQVDTFPDVDVEYSMLYSVEKLKQLSKVQLHQREFDPLYLDERSSGFTFEANVPSGLTYDFGNCD